MQFNLLTKQGKRIHQAMQENINYLVKAMERRKKKERKPLAVVINRTCP